LSKKRTMRTMATIATRVTSSLIREQRYALLLCTKRGFWSDYHPWARRCLHGAGGRLWLWQRLQSRLEKRSYRVAGPCSVGAASERDGLRHKLDRAGGGAPTGDRA
jgi:hypothetical protein